MQCRFQVVSVEWDRMAAEQGIRRQVRTLRACGNSATFTIGDIEVCAVHDRALRDAIRREIAADPRSRAEMAQLIADYDDEYRKKRDAEHRQLLRARPGYVYYVHRAGFVKIGFSRNVATRLKQLERGGDKRPASIGLGPVELLASHRGTEASEAKMHAKFADDRVEGEWFRLSAALRHHITEMAERQPTKRTRATA